MIRSTHIVKLTELMKIHKSKLGDEDHWRAFSYSKSIKNSKQTCVICLID